MYADEIEEVINQNKMRNQCQTKNPRKKSTQFEGHNIQK